MTDYYTPERGCDDITFCSSDCGRDCARLSLPSGPCSVSDFEPVCSGYQRPQEGQMQDSYKIDKDVPMPPNRVASGRQTPLSKAMRAMQVGDSMYVYNRVAAYQAVCGFNCRHKRFGARWAARRDGDGVRIWRVA